MMSIDAIKAQARKAGFAARKAAHAAASAGGQEVAAQAHLRDLLSGFGEVPLAGYMPIRTEIDPLPAMAAHGGAVGVPVILGAGQPLVFHRWTPGCAMVAGAFGAMIPASGDVVVPRVVIVPLVGFDARGYRLGYGGGFYDRTLARLRMAGPVTALGFAFDAQQLPEVPTDAHDQRLDGIVTEAGVRWFG